MAIFISEPDGYTELTKKQVELVKFNDKYYIEVKEFENLDSIVELSIALVQENEALNERIQLLEKLLQCRKGDN